MKALDIPKNNSLFFPWSDTRTAVWQEASGEQRHQEREFLGWDHSQQPDFKLIEVV